MRKKGMLVVALIMAMALTACSEQKDAGGTAAVSTTAEAKSQGEAKKEVKSETEAKM